MSGETEKQVSGWTVDTLKEHLETRLKATGDAVAVARIEMDRRLAELNQLRKEVTDDRSQLVQDVVFDELRKQVNELSGKVITLTSDMASNASDISTMRNSLSWLTRLIAGALILGLIAFAFQKIGR